MSQAAERSKADRFSARRQRCRSWRGAGAWRAQIGQRLGHSLGKPSVAWAAAQLAAEQPECCVAIVVMAGSPGPAQVRIHALPHVGAWTPVQRLLPRAIRIANAGLTAPKPELEALRLALERSC
jgi:pimeloyl-ACP methyl ester carboxylesterase